MPIIIFLLSRAIIIIIVIAFGRLSAPISAACPPCPTLRWRQRGGTSSLRSVLPPHCLQRCPCCPPRGHPKNYRIGGTRQQSAPPPACRQKRAERCLLKQPCLYPLSLALVPFAPLGGTIVMAWFSGRSRENKGLCFSLSLRQGLFSRAPPPPHPRRCLRLAPSVVSLWLQTAIAPAAIASLRHPQAKGIGSRAPPKGGLPFSTQKMLFSI